MEQKIVVTASRCCQIGAVLQTGLVWKVRGKNWGFPHGAADLKVEKKEEEKTPNGQRTGKLVSGAETTMMKHKAWRHFQHLIQELT